MCPRSLDSHQPLTVRLVHVVSILTRIRSAPRKTGTGMLFLDESQDVTIAAHLLWVGFFCLFVCCVFFGQVGFVVHLHWWPSPCVQITLFKEKRSGELHKGFAVSANRTDV